MNLLLTNSMENLPAVKLIIESIYNYNSNIVYILSDLFAIPANCNDYDGTGRRHNNNEIIYNIQTNLKKTRHIALNIEDIRLILAEARTVAEMHLFCVSESLIILDKELSYDLLKNSCVFEIKIYDGGGIIEAIAHDEIAESFLEELKKSLDKISQT